MPKLTVSLVLRALFVLLLVGMVVLALIGTFVRPASPEVSLQQTVDAAVRSTQSAPRSSPNPTELQATVDSAIQATLTATTLPPPTPLSPQDQVSESVGGVWDVVLWMWNLFSFWGLWSQLCCCVIIPLLLLVGVVTDSARR